MPFLVKLEGDCKVNVKDTSMRSIFTEECRRQRAIHMEKMKEILEKNLILEFCENHITGGFSCVHIEAKKAVAYQKSLYTYLSDEVALEDFIHNHWCKVLY